MNTETKLIAIDSLAKKYSDARARLAQLVADYEDAIRTVQRHHRPSIKQIAGVAAQRQSELAAEIGAAPELFVKPRTITLHGIKLGFAKGKGRITWDDTEKVVERIRKLLPFEADALLRTKVEPIRDALLNLDIATLKKLGCTVEEAGDAIYIKAADSEIDKLVARILEEGAVAE